MKKYLKCSLNLTETVNRYYESSSKKISISDVLLQKLIQDVRELNRLVACFVIVNNDVELFNNLNQQMNDFKNSIEQAISLDKKQDELLVNKNS